MNKQWKFWMLASALACAVACGDDESPSNEKDAATTEDPVLPETDAGEEEEVDAGEEDEVDAGDVEGDAGDLAADAGETPDAAEPESIEITGRWFGGMYDLSVEISDEVFGNQTVIEYDNEANVVYTQADADNFIPNAFSRIVWSEPVEGAFYYCTIIYDAETLEDAKTREVELDTAHPETAPCGAGYWTKFVPVIEIEGKWEETAFAVDYTIDSLTWTSSSEYGTYGSTVVTYDNAANVAYVQDAMTTKFHKYVWLQNDDGSFYYCTVAYGQDNVAAADTNAQPAIETTPATSGCGDTNSPWSKLTPAASN